MTSFIDPLLRTDPASCALVNDRHGRVVAGTLLTAFDSSSRRRGLLGRDSLPEDSALIIVPSNAIHTFFMRFAIDVAFLSKTGRVLKTCSAIPPWRISWAWGGFAVVELPAGALARCDTRRGDTLRITTN